MFVGTTIETENTFRMPFFMYKLFFIFLFQMWQDIERMIMATDGVTSSGVAIAVKAECPTDHERNSNDNNSSCDRNNGSRPTIITSQTMHDNTKNNEEEQLSVSHRPSTEKPFIKLELLESVSLKKYEINFQLMYAISK